MPCPDCSREDRHRRLHLEGSVALQADVRALWQPMVLTAAFNAGAKAHLAALRTASYGIGINWDTGSNITGIPSRWNVSTPDPNSGPLAQLNTSTSGNSKPWPHTAITLFGTTVSPCSRAALPFQSSVSRTQSSQEIL